MLLPTDPIFISFNGGKDCLAAYILIKYYFFCQERWLDYSNFSSFVNFNNNNISFTTNYKIYFVYFISDNNFLEEENYVINFSKKEMIEVFYLYTDYISGLNFLIKNFNLKLIVMGTRLNDFGNNNDADVKHNLIHPSTHPYPCFSRFYSIFNFTFEDVWRLILLGKFDYLNLYNKGYSSLGKKNNTKINENLRLNDRFILPAWCLEQEQFRTERSYRSNN